MHAPAEGPPASDRFSIVGRLGSGGMGVVYRALDQTRGLHVALKTLTRADPVRLYRLKQEFRALADLVHPNLAALYELLVENDRGFFTMELIEGVNFLQYVRGHSGLDSSTGSPTLSVETPGMARNVSSPSSPEVEPYFEPVDLQFELLRESFSQLVRGLAFLHDSGKVHCDIKPSNVLVERSGRVVLLDFGLVTELSDASQSSDVGGTPNYMAPEQMSGKSLTAATDWYAAGVMLYQCLTGRLPVALGTPRTEVMELTPVSLLNPRVPGDLARLCMELLSYHPKTRAGRSQLIRVFHIDSSHVEIPSSGKAPSFVGRGS